MRESIAVVCLVMGACQPAAQDPAVLTLGGQSVRRSEFLQYLRRLEARGEGPLEPHVRAAVLESFLEARALALEARRRGFVAPGADELQEAAGIRKLLEAEVLAGVQVTPQEIQREYEAQTCSPNVPERRGLSQILLPNLNEARDVRRRLDRDPKSFEILARTRSRAPEAALGGALGVLGAWAFSFALAAILGGIMSANFSAPVRLWAVLLALIASSVVGLIAGIYPASRAAALDPVVALRNE